jgi:outer membrane protein TolC
MKLYKKILLIGLAPIVVNAQSLKEIVDYSLKNNHNIKSLQIDSKSKQKTYESTKNIYNPTITTGINYSKLDLDVRDTQIGSTAAMFIKFGITLYDGGKNKAIKNQKRYEYETTVLNSATTKKELILQIITLFYQAKTVDENIKALKEKSTTLKAEYERVKTKYDMQMLTYDNVLKLQSEYEANKYSIEELQYQKNQLLKNLSLLSGLEIDTLDDSTLAEIKDLKFSESESIKALKTNIKALDENIKIVASSKKPQLKIENSFNIYSYDDYNDKLLKDLPDQQNQLMINLTYNLFDTNSDEKKQAALLAKKAKMEQLSYLKTQEKINFDLAKQKLSTQKLKIKSAKSALDMANSVFEIIKTKYQNGVVDNITYLDALSKKTANMATYKQALYEYEIAKANYYLSSGIDYKEILGSIF